MDILDEFDINIIKELEKDGLIFREYYKEVPPRVEYSLTEFGQSLTQVFNSIVLWAEQNLIDSK